MTSSDINISFRVIYSACNRHWRPTHSHTLSLALSHSHPHSHSANISLDHTHSLSITFWFSQSITLTLYTKFHIFPTIRNNLYLKYDFLWYKYIISSYLFCVQSSLTTHSLSLPLSLSLSLSLCQYLTRSHTLSLSLSDLASLSPWHYMLNSIYFRQWEIIYI